jgi:hypothetical protein
MLYRVILTMNGKYKKTLHRCKTEGTSYANFNKIKMENKVFFEKRFVNSNGIIPVKYKIYVVKDWEESDKPRLVRDNAGRLIDEPKFGDWTILHDSSYMIEETFWVYGYNNIHDRKTIKDIMSLLVLGLKDKNYVKQVVVVNNKLLIYSEEQFDMVICKNKEDAQRLHHTLYKASMSDKKLKNLLFMGTSNKNMLGHYYEIIHEKTGWNYTKIWRTTTRP